MGRRADYNPLLVKVISDAAWENWSLFVLKDMRKPHSPKSANLMRFRRGESRENLLPMTMTSELDANLPNVRSEHPYCRFAAIVAPCGLSCLAGIARVKTFVCEEP